MGAGKVKSTGSRMHPCRAPLVRGAGDDEKLINLVVKPLQSFFSTTRQYKINK